MFIHRHRLREGERDRKPVLCFILRICCVVTTQALSPLCAKTYRPPLVVLERWGFLLTLISAFLHGKEILGFWGWNAEFALLKPKFHSQERFSDHSGLPTSVRLPLEAPPCILLSGLLPLWCQSFFVFRQRPLGNLYIKMRKRWALLSRSCDWACFSSDHPQLMFSQHPGFHPRLIAMSRSRSSFDLKDLSGPPFLPPIWVPGSLNKSQPSFLLWLSGISPWIPDCLCTQNPVLMRWPAPCPCLD